MLRELAPELADARARRAAGGAPAAAAHVAWIDAAGDDGELPGCCASRRCTPAADADDPQRRRRSRKTLKADDPINIQFTSGTTGFPKGATLTHRNILNNGFIIGECMKLTPDDRLCIPVPFYHCFGMVLGNLACVTHGATMVYPAEVFDPLTVLQTVEAENCTGAARRADHVHRRTGPSASSRSSTSPPCAPASWPARPARSR